MSSGSTSATTNADNAAIRFDGSESEAAPARNLDFTFLTGRLGPEYCQLIEPRLDQPIQGKELKP